MLSLGVNNQFDMYGQTSLRDAELQPRPRYGVPPRLERPLPLADPRPSTGLGPCAICVAIDSPAFRPVESFVTGGSAWIEPPCCCSKVLAIARSL